ncbi:MAG: helix-turn-helix domain-containing protein [Oscillospiraceae bacterium]|nr:helix-turn-helix domain-containing protein [Oscillospiraceae bacterium]
MTDSMGSRLKQLRLDKRLRQEQLAALIGVNKRQVSAYENNTRQPSYDILIRIATIYRVSTDYLLGCQVNKSIDVSGLTPTEIALITDLVDDMTSKNEILEEYNIG